MSDQQHSQLTVIVLAAGHGKRMKSRLPKPLHTIGGRSMVGHVLAAVAELGADRVVTVVGHGRELVTDHVLSLDPDIAIAVQEEQLGTGHAARIGLDACAQGAGAGAGAPVAAGDVLVLTADTPLLTGATLRRFLEQHRDARAAQESRHVVSILTAQVPDPTGYGRIVRDAEGGVRAIVEEKDATPEQRGIAEINSGILLFDAAFLTEVLPRLGNANASAEYYLTDTVALACSEGRRVDGFLVSDHRQTEGANDRAQLAALGKALNRRTVEHWMREGVSVVDPDTTWIDVDAELASDVTLLPGVQLLGATTVAEDAVVGPDCTLTDTEVGAGARVVRTHSQLAVIGEGAEVGPFSYLRPGTILGAKGKIGGFVETKNASIGAGAKVPHLSYVGDAEIGEGANIGAGTIFANYDGVNKHRTVIGRHAKTGSNNTFVAPAVVGDGASTGGGTTVRGEVPAGALAVSAGPLRIIEGWAMRKRAGTPQGEAAAAASEQANGQADGQEAPQRGDERESSHNDPSQVGNSTPGGTQFE